ncbi:MAG: hypothetical protein ABIS06_11070 [Vicinamibacterales bacterium]
MQDVLNLFKTADVLEDDRGIQGASNEDEPGNHRFKAADVSGSCETAQRAAVIANERLEGFQDVGGAPERDESALGEFARARHEARSGRSAEQVIDLFSGFGSLEISDSGDVAF